MSIEIGTTDYELIVPFDYHSIKAGGSTPAAFITLRGPEFAHSKNAYRIGQMCSNLLNEGPKKFAEYADSEEVQTAAGEEINKIKQMENKHESVSAVIEDMLRAYLMVSDAIDVYDFVNEFVEMLNVKNCKRNIAMIDGEVALKKTHVERMDLEDILSLALRWASFFGIQSKVRDSISSMLFG